MLNNNIILIIVISLNINSLLVGYLLGRYFATNGVNNNVSSSFFNQQKNFQYKKPKNNIEIDEKKIVVKIDTEGLEKKYDSLGDVKNTQENISESVNKLKNLKGNIMSKGIDIGTSFIVLSTEKDGVIEYKDFRDAFYIIKPSTPVATKMIEKGLSGKTFIKDNDGSFILLGKDAIEKAIERNDNAKRPMSKGVVSAKEKDAKRVLAFILKEVVGTPSESSEKLIFCVPAQPVDVEDEDFDVGYHEDTIKAILNEVGYDARAINEAEAICYAELGDDDYTGLTVSAGSGMHNICVMLNGEPTVKLSTVRSGDWIDRMSSVATGEKDTVVQAEKEGGGFTIGESNENPILSAVSSYYERLIDYTTRQISFALTNHKSLPKFKEPIKIVIAGGTSLAKGYIEMFTSKLKENNFPLEIKEVVHAADPLHSVSKGCLIAAKVL